MRREIVLPTHLYDRIKASAGEHGGIGIDDFFSRTGMPQCAHGHAWGTYSRMMICTGGHERAEPELSEYITWFDNDLALEEAQYIGRFGRVSFARWCEILNVKRAPDTPASKKQSQESLESVPA